LRAVSVDALPRSPPSQVIRRPHAARRSLSKVGQRLTDVPRPRAPFRITFQGEGCTRHPPLAAACPRSIALSSRRYLSIGRRADKDYACFALDPKGNVEDMECRRGAAEGLSRAGIIGKHFSSLHQGGLARDWPARELQMALARVASRTRAGACARTARVLGERRHHRAARRGWQAHRLFQDHARPQRRRMHEEALRQSEERFRSSSRA
jgi:hypothetical protein